MHLPVVAQCHIAVTPLTVTLAVGVGCSTAIHTRREALNMHGMIDCEMIDCKTHDTYTLALFLSFIS